MSLHAARGGPHEDPSWSVIGRRAPRDVTFGDREGGGGTRSAQQGPEAVRVDEASSASTFRELDEAFLQTQTKIWLGEVLHLRFGEDTLVADLLADGELLFQVSKILWKRLLKYNREQLEQSKVYIYERPSFGRSSGKYMPYSKVDSFLKICQILGLAGIDLFTPSDVVEKRNVRKVCICIRSVSKKSHILHLDVPDFDVVTYTISMPNYFVGGICRSLEQTQYSSSSSSGYSPCARSKVLQQQIIFGGQNDQHEDTYYDSDEAESKLSLLEPEDNFAAVLSQFSDAPNKESEGYGESGHDKHEEKSLAESVGSLNIGIIDSEFLDSSPLIHDKESCSLLEPEDSVNEDNFAAVLSQFSDGPNEGSEGYGESGHDKHEERSLAESVGSLTIGIIDSEFMGSSPLIHDKESCSTRSATDQCSRTRTAKCELSTEESDSTSSHLVLDSGKNYLELNIHSVTDSERIYDRYAKSVDHHIQGDGETLAEHPKKEEAGLQKDTGGTTAQHRDALACDRESVCSSSEEPRHGLNGEPSDLSSESHSRLTPTHNTGGKLSTVSEHPVNNTESNMTGMTSDSSTYRELNPEASTRNEMVPPDGSQSIDKPVEPEDVAQDSATPRPEDDAPRSGKGVLKSVAGGITLVGAVFFVIRLSAALLQKKQGGKVCDGYTISFGKIGSERREGQEHGQRKRP